MALAIAAPDGAAAGGAALEAIQALFELVDGLPHALQPVRVLLVVLDLGHLGVQALDQVLQLADVIPALTLVNRPVGRHQHAYRGHLAAAAAGTVSAGHGVVVVAIENQTLGVAAGLGRVLPEPRRGVVRLAQELELVLAAIGEPARSDAAR